VSAEASPEAPIYRAVRQDDGYATARFMIVCDEGWREQIVCCDMYDWAADWLLKVLERRPFVPSPSRRGLGRRRPGEHLVDPRR
jgi:hypothetical protein